MYSIQSYLGSIPSFFFKTAICRPTLKLQNHFVITTSLAHSPPKKKTFHCFRQGTEANSCSTHFRRICSDVNSWLKCEAAKKAWALVKLLFRPALRDKSRWFSKSRKISEDESQNQKRGQYNSSVFFITSLVCFC